MPHHLALLALRRLRHPHPRPLLRQLAQRGWHRVAPWLPWVGVVLLLALLLQAAPPWEMKAALDRADLRLTLPVLACTLGSLVLRAMRWHLLVQAIAAPNSLLDSLLLYTAAQAALLIPGGQFLLPVLQRSQHGTLIRRSAATILVQELVWGLLVLPAALPGIPEYHPAGWLLLISFVFNVGTSVALLHGDLMRLILRLLRHVPFLRHHTGHLAELQLHFGTIAGSRAAILGSLLDMAAIGLLGLAFYFALQAVGAAHLGWIDGLAVYSLGAAVGTISALPGGLGATEDISTLVLTRLGLTPGTAAAATLLFRAANVLIGSALGWLVLVLGARRMNVHPSIGGLIRAVRGAQAHVEGGTPIHRPPERALQE